MCLLPDTDTRTAILNLILKGYTRRWTPKALWKVKRSRLVGRLVLCGTKYPGAGCASPGLQNPKWSSLNISKLWKSKNKGRILLAHRVQLCSRWLHAFLFWPSSSYVKMLHVNLKWFLQSFTFLDTKLTQRGKRIVKVQFRNPFKLDRDS